MKKLIILSLVLSVIYSTISHAQTESGGVIFFKGTWKDAQNEAKNQQKLVFIDFYTDWCVPCKRMDVEIFPDKNVGALYNKLFINIKVNAEKERECCWQKHSAFGHIPPGSLPMKLVMSFSEDSILC
ncbi:thioredoxin family protein [Pedobacter frigidisoli]|uniref:thioredoxin family protein n=1 Tax=Pedobacter frigidisoli TaxID=2530455 RepID=UPI002931D10F|nr:DUF255 domain-containing protein [Pedobacter frigidisoli]